MSNESTNAVPLTGLGQKEVKSELTSLYGITDFSDCLELSDLKRKLATVRDSQPITHGFRYGRLLQIGNTRNPTGLVTLSHGLGDSCDGWRDVGDELAHRFPYLLFLLPTAPQRPVTVNGGYMMPAWYDIYGMISANPRAAQQDAVGVFQSADYLTSLSSTTCKRLKIAPRRVCFCGFSQGAAVSLAAALVSAAAPPAGVAMMSGYLPAAQEVLAKHEQLVANNAAFAELFANPEKSMKFAMFHGRQDPVVPITAARETKQALETVVLAKQGAAAKVSFHEYNMQHSAVPQEIDELARFLKQVLPEESASGL